MSQHTKSSHPTSKRITARQKWRLHAGASLCVVVLAAAGCSSGKSAKQDSVAVTPSRALEHHGLDLDGDGVPDSVTAVRPDSGGHGATRRIELQLSRGGARVLEDSAGWDPAPDEFNGNGNLLQSRLLYVADFYRAGRLLFLFGTKVGCCQQSLAIYRLGANGPEKYFDAPEIWIDRSPVPQASKVAFFAGRKLSQGVTPPSSEFVSAVTYAPVVAYRLEDKPRIDSAMTRTLTQQELGGFAGFGARPEIIAVRKRDGSRLLWNLAENRAMR